MIGLRVNGERRTDPEQLMLAKMRRDRLRALGVCLNGEAHGKATHGVLCGRCRDVHRRGAKQARQEM